MGNASFNRWRSCALVIVSAVAVALLAPPGGARPEGGPPECGIFVATTGTNAAGVGLTPNDPCATIQFGISRAVAEGLSCVFVQAGTYNEKVTLASGVSIIGGYDTSWQPGPYINVNHQTIMTGRSPTAPFARVIATDLVGAPASISNVIIIGPDAPAASPGASAYAVYVNNTAAIILSNLRIEAGDGAAGAVGGTGSNAPNLSPTAAMNGTPGQGGSAPAGCNDTAHGLGGPPGTNSCTGGVGSNGGMGGNGGEADEDCPFLQSPTPGDPGQSGAQPGGGIGGGGSGGGVCASPLAPSQPGRITNGLAGIESGGGSVVGGLWVSNSGGAGGIGENGGGGGGGGGAGGCDSASGDVFGGGGGGGGAGGCRAPMAASGGQGGGGSFGVFAVNSSLTLNTVEILRGLGGNGGNGGAGGRGQAGGLGGSGGPTPGGGSGGPGGNGGHGGHGGGGGGGAGGPSFGVQCQGSTISSTAVTVIGGAPGIGGVGGISAPGVPAPFDDGNDGGNGVGGALGAINACTVGAPATPAACDPDPCVPCLGDIAPPGGNDVVNVSDLLALIGEWGACDVPCPPCPGDLAPPGGNCVVNVSDLLALINLWGPCD